MSTNVTKCIDVTPETVEVSQTCSGDTVTHNTHCVDMEHPDTVITGIKKEYSIVGDAIYASVNTGDAPLWLVTLIDALVTNQLANGMYDYDSLVQDVRNAIASIDIAYNNFVEQIWFDQNIDSIITARVEQINATLGETYATITSLQLTQATLEQSLAASITQLESDYQGYTDGQITNIQSTLSNAIGTLQTSITALTAAYEDETTGLAATASALQALSTYTGQLGDALTARSEWAVNLDAFLGGNNGTLWGGQSSITDTIQVTSNGLIQAAFEYDATLISTTGQYYKTGFGLVTEAGAGTEGNPFTSSFWVQADHFKVVPAGGSPNPSDSPLFAIDAATGQTIIGSQWTERNSITVTGTFSSLPSSLQLTQEFQTQTGETVIRKGDTLVYTVTTGVDAGNYTAYWTGLDWSTNVALQVHGDAVINGSLSLNKLIADPGGYLASSNFVTGVSGWAITGAGDAEFNTLSVRSSQIQGGLTGTESFYFDGIYVSGSTEPYLVLPVGNGGSAASGTNKFGTELGDHYGLDHPVTWTITNDYDIDATVTLSGVFNFGSGPTPAAGTGGHGQPADVQLKIYIKRSGVAKQPAAGGATTMVYSTQMYTSGRFPIAAGETVDITVCVAGGYKPTSKNVYFYGGSMIAAMSTDITQNVVPPLVLPGQIEDDGLTSYRYMWSDTENGVYSETRGVNDVWQRVDTSIDAGETWTLGTPVNVQGPQGDTGPQGTPGVDGDDGPTGPRVATGYLYYQLSSSTAPASPSASSYNFTSGQFGSLTSNWSSSPPTFVAGNSNKYWYVYYTVRESTFGGSQTVTKGSVTQGIGFSGLVTFSGTTLTNGSTNFNYTQIDGGWITSGTISALDQFQAGSSGLVSNSRTIPNPDTGTYSNPPKPTPVSTTSCRFLVDDNGFTYVDTLVNYGHIFGSTLSLSTTSANPFWLYTGSSSAIAARFQRTTSREVHLCSSAGGVDVKSGGYYDSSGVGYLPFTGVHQGLIAKTEVVVPGDILLDELIVFKKGVSDAVGTNIVSSAPNQKSVIGVFASRSNLLDDPDDLANAIDLDNYVDNEGRPASDYVDPTKMGNYAETFDLCLFNSVGEGLVNVTGEGGDIEIGDLIVTSSTAGKGMKQADDIVRSITVAKSRENVTFADPTEVKQIACIYLCG